MKVLMKDEHKEHLHKLSYGMIKEVLYITFDFKQREWELEHITSVMHGYYWTRMFSFLIEDNPISITIVPENEHENHLLNDCQFFDTADKCIYKLVFIDRDVFTKASNRVLIDNYPKE